MVWLLLLPPPADPITVTFGGPDERKDGTCVFFCIGGILSLDPGVSSRPRDQQRPCIRVLGFVHPNFPRARRVLWTNLGSHLFITQGSCFACARNSIPAQVPSHDHSTATCLFQVVSFAPPPRKEFLTSTVFWNFVASLLQPLGRAADTPHRHMMDIVSRQ